MTAPGTNLRRAPQTGWWTEDSNAVLPVTATLTANLFTPAVFHDAASSGTRATGTTTATTSWTHTTNNHPNLVAILWLRWHEAGGSAPTTRTPTYDGAAMTFIAGSYGSYNVELYGKTGVAIGAKTVAVTVARSGATGIQFDAAVSTYHSVGSWTGAVSTSGSGSTWSHTITGTCYGRMVVQGVGGGGVGNYNNTLRFIASNASDPFASLFGDSVVPAGAQTQTFSGTCDPVGWASLAVQLVPSF